MAVEQADDGRGLEVRCQAIGQRLAPFGVIAGGCGLPLLPNVRARSGSSPASTGSGCDRHRRLVAIPARDHGRQLAGVSEACRLAGSWPRSRCGQSRTAEYRWPRRDPVGSSHHVGVPCVASAQLPRAHDSMLICNSLSATDSAGRYRSYRSRAIAAIKGMGVALPVARNSVSASVPRADSTAATTSACRSGSQNPILDSA